MKLGHQTTFQWQCPGVQLGTETVEMKHVSLQVILRMLLYDWFMRQVVLISFKISTVH